jgi:hypothetical protein
MSIFLCESELEAIKNRKRNTPLDDLLWLFLNKSKERQSQTGLVNLSSTQDWWHLAFEYISESALSYRIKEDEGLGAWIRSTVLAIVRRPVCDWVGPTFRDHTLDPPAGNLETAHLSWSVSFAYDLCPSLFTPEEQKEIETCLIERAIGLCQNYCDTLPRKINNWYCILLAGVIVPAAVLGRQDILEDNLERVKLCFSLFQEDGSYGESAQYANYALQGLFLITEAYKRSAPLLLDLQHCASYAKAARFWVYNHIHRKNLSGWGHVSRSFNFGDSAAIFAPSADILLHMAATLKEVDPESASLAKWLFEEAYLPVEQPMVDDRSSFGFVPGIGIFTLILLPRSCEARGPEQLERSRSFENGYTYMRDCWGGDSSVAVAGCAKSLNTVAHSHGDINSLIVTHRGERFLVDPGHSCYRGLVHLQEIVTLHHNTCSFIQNSKAHRTSLDSFPGLIPQNGASGIRKISKDGLSDTVKRGKTLGFFDDGFISHCANDAGELYDAPLDVFERHIILCGAQVIYIVDRIVADEPVTPLWTWVLNNRDGKLEVNPLKDRLVARRGSAGMKIFHGGGGCLSGPQYGYMHDAYHPLPGEKGEGLQGSAHLYRWTGSESRKEHTVVHAIALGGYGEIASWHYETTGKEYTLYSLSDNTKHWTLSLEQDGFTLCGKKTGRSVCFGSKF